MRNRIERLRVWLVAGAVLLLVVLAAFIGSARYLARHRLYGKLASLAANVKRDATGVTYSHSSLGGTEYTIHAAKEVDYKDGKIALHDVSMVLYGQKHDRADRIYGNEFEYDQNAGVLKAIGLVHIDMQSAAVAQAGGGAGKEHPANELGKLPELHEADGQQAKVLHATTSGLVYMDKLGVAATGEPIEFQLGQVIGHATGADYNTDTGVLMLHSAVDMSGVAGARPVTLTAATAELDSRDQVAYMSRAKYVSLGRTVEADHATLHTRRDGSIARVEAQGNVTGTEAGARLVAQRADVLLNAKSQPESAVLSGELLYALDGVTRQARGQAQEARIAFDAKGQAHHAVFTGAVHLVERTRATEAARQPWSVRDLEAAKVDVLLGPDAAGKAQIHDVDAAGSAHLTLVNNGSLERTKGEGRTDLYADDLKTHMVTTGEVKKPTRIDTLVGRGHTVLTQLGADGVEQTSAGETLDARFRPVAGGKTGKAADSLLSAVQQGHVTMMRRVPAGVKAAGKASAGADEEHAVAERAAYDGDLDRVTLTGSVQLTDAGSEMWAERVGLDHQTGDALAEGSVKVVYAQDAGPRRAGSSEPAHILADRADLKHATQIATFYGKPARLWQGGSQVQAPVLEFARMQRRVVARGESGDGDAPVHTLLVSAGSSQTKAGAVKVASDKTGKARPLHMVRIASRELVYLELSHEADFTGGVRMDSTDGTIVAREATVYLQAGESLQGSKTESESAAATAGLTLDSSIDHIVATGKIEIAQPGRRATGERLVYTAADGLSVLTGSVAAPPKVVDSTKGTVITGAALQFYSGDESVVVSGDDGTLPGRRVRTDARVKK